MTNPLLPSDYFLKIDESVDIYSHDQTLYWKANAVKDIIEYSAAIVTSSYHVELKNIVFQKLRKLRSILVVQLRQIVLFSQQQEYYAFLDMLLKKFSAYSNKSDPAIAAELEKSEELHLLFKLVALPIAQLNQYQLKGVVELSSKMRKNSVLFRQLKVVH